MRLDSGVVEGSVIGGAFDSMIAKLMVTGRTREQALERSRRALAEFVVEGLPTVLPFHRAVVSDPAFAPRAGDPFTMHTRWIETEFDNQIAPYGGARGEAAEPERAATGSSSRSAGKRLEVCFPAGWRVGGGRRGRAPRAPGDTAPKRRRPGGRRAGAARVR